MSIPIFPLSRPPAWVRMPEHQARALYPQTKCYGNAFLCQRKSPHPAFGHPLPLLRNGRGGMTDSVSSFLASQVSYAIALPTRGGERMTILAEPLYFDGLAVLKTSLHNATEICVCA